MEYPLCDRTVTVYRLREGSVQRQVFDRCYFRRTDSLAADSRGLQRKSSFLLILPGENLIYPGDRIYEGEGPQVSFGDWPDFTPEKVPGLVVAQQATPFYWQGRLSHYEAS